MPTNRAAPSKQSSNPKTTRGTQDRGKPTNPDETRMSRAQRSGTPEARAQQARTPKTHPTRATPAARKDKPAKLASRGTPHAR
jgi:hypothetical protein